jgi:hypothetical protein
MFSRLLGKKERIVCPRCLTSIQVQMNKLEDKPCPDCKYMIPMQYIAEFKIAPPLFIQVFGWSNSGKTMWLDVMRLMLFDMPVLWSRFIFDPVTQLDLDHQRILKAERRMGKRTGSTQKRDRDNNDVYIMRLDNMERWGSRSLVIMDHAGEQFVDFNVPVAEIPFLIKTPTTFLFISMYDMEKNRAGESMDQLLSIYIKALTRNGIDFKKQRRKLIVVLTKGDMISNLSDPIQEYLVGDTFWERINTKGHKEMFNDVDVANYMERMGRVSNHIRQWLTENPDGVNLVRLIERNNIEARYTIISATGQDIDEADNTFQIVPRRVLDPFFWALEFQSRDTQ